VVAPGYGGDHADADEQHSQYHDSHDPVQQTGGRRKAHLLRAHDLLPARALGVVTALGAFLSFSPARNVNERA